MKYLYFYIVIFISFFKGIALAGELPDLPEDFEGESTKLYVQQKAEDDQTSLTISTRFSIFMEIGKYLDEKYPGDKLYSDDILPDLRRFLPEDDEETFTSHVILIRNSLTVYRKTKEFIQKRVAQKLVPPVYREVHSEEDFDHPDEVPYFEAEPNHFIKVYNFKKFLTYSDNTEETAAITRFKHRLTENMTLVDQLNAIFSKVEWKKALLYGTKYKNPLLTERGVGPMLHGQNVSARLLSLKTYIKNQTEMDFGLELVTSLNRFILANNLSPKLHKPVLNLDKSENIADYQILYPAPLNSAAIPYAHKYFGDFMIPIKVKPADPQKPITLKLEAKLFSCGNNLLCVPEYFETELTIEPSGSDILNNGYDNFFFQNYSLLPQDETPYLTLKKAVVDQDEDRQALRLEFTTEQTIKNFKVFIEEKDGYTRFSAPHISIRDNIINVRFLPLDEDKNNTLTDSEFEITAVLNTHYALRTTRLAQKASPFDIETPKLNFALLMLALLGGFILNFMPCVFPILSLKIMALSQTTSRRSKQIKRAVKQTIYGIFSGFTLIITFLLSAKYLGYSLGWGMQFQNISFLIAMTFVIASFTAVLPHIDFDGLYRYTVTRPGKTTNFMIGNLIVLLSTPCTAPYLATAIGFALTGSYFDIICILYMVALGLSLPYFLILSLKRPETLFPKPGPWLKKLHLLMQIMLYLTILWFLSLILGQTNWLMVIKLGVSIFVFALMFKLYKLFLDYLEGIFDESITPQTLSRARRGATVLIGALFLGLTIWCSTNAQKQQKEPKNTPIATNLELIEQKLGQGKAVLLEIGADWCMTCHVNNFLTLTPAKRRVWQKKYNLELMKIDWTNYNRQTLDFMEKYGRKGLPFYILYTPLLRDGIVLPEMFSPQDVENLLIDAGQR